MSLCVCVCVCVCVCGLGFLLTDIFISHWLQDLLNG